MSLVFLDGIYVTHRWRIVKMTVGVSSAEYHSLHRVGAAVHIFMGEGGPTLVTTAD